MVAGRSEQRERLGVVGGTGGAGKSSRGHRREGGGEGGWASGKRGGAALGEEQAGHGPRGCDRGSVVKIGERQRVVEERQDEGEGDHKEEDQWVDLVGI